MPTTSPISAKLATGLTVDNEWTTVTKSKKKSKSKPKQEENSEKQVNNDLTHALRSLSVDNKVKNNGILNNKSKKVGNYDNKDSDVVRNEFGQPLATEPTKRLRNLKKKLKEIQELKAKDPKLLEKEQLEKISREDEIVEQINELQRFIDNN